MADTMNWLSFGTTQAPATAKASTGAKKNTPYDKMLKNFDDQYAMWKAGKKPETRMGQAKALFKDHGGVTEVSVRYSGKLVPIFPEGATSFYVADKKNVKAVYQGIRSDLEARAFADVFTKLDADVEATNSQRAATRGSKAK